MANANTDMARREAPPVATEAPAEEDDGLLAETLIEEVSIDGMCGVY